MAKTPADTNGDTSGGSKLIDQVLIAHLSSTDRNSQELLRPDVQGLHGDPDRDAQNGPINHEGSLVNSKQYNRSLASGNLWNEVSAKPLLFQSTSGRIPRLPEIHDVVEGERRTIENYIRNLSGTRRSNSAEISHFLFAQADTIAEVLRWTLPRHLTRGFLPTVDTSAADLVESDLPYRQALLQTARKYSGELTRAIKRGNANLDELSQRLERLSRNLRACRVDECQVTSFLRNCVELERGCLLHASELPPDPSSATSSWRRALATSSKDAYYFSSPLENVVYKTSLSPRLPNFSKSAEEVYRAEKGHRVQGVCIIKEVGMFALVVAPIVDEAFGTNWQSELRLIKSQCGTKSPLACKVAAAEKSDNLSLCANGNQLIVVDHQDSTVAVFSAYSPLEASQTTPYLTETLRFVLESGLAGQQGRPEIQPVMRSFSLSIGCAHAIATYHPFAVVYKVTASSQMHHRTVIVNRREDQWFRDCAISTFGICLIGVAMSTNQNQLKLFNLDGLELRSIVHREHINCPIDQFVYFRSSLAVYETVSDREMLFVFRPAGRDELRYLRVRSSRHRHELLCRKRPFKFLSESEAQCQYQLHNTQVTMVTTDVAQVESLRTSSDLLEPQVAGISQCNDSTYVLDKANNSVKCLNAAAGATNCNLLFDGYVEGDATEVVTGVSVLDERTLALVQANHRLLLLQVDSSPTRLLHSIRFTKTLQHPHDVPSFVCFVSGRLYIVKRGDCNLFEIKVVRDFAELRLRAVYFTSDWLVQHLQLDVHSKCLLMLSSNGTSRRVSILDERLTETIRLPLPEKHTTVHSCLLYKRKCVVELTTSPNWRREHLLYELDSGAPLRAIKLDLVAALPGFLGIYSTNSLNSSSFLALCSRVIKRCSFQLVTTCE